ncbi:DUF1673 domain-containing protein [Methanosarcina sp. UBA5]|uniref:DUF1673 domain-containing protein n=1 Tax=Methanosarcina sp. UBA5 TaxID=1915593 RepID=UPI0025EFA7CB|nr:DUF1673 domain-containing protein [Methanosarcina sp. UBA5]
MNVLIKNIRKLMGWCRNAKMLETQHSIHSEYFEANDQAKGRDDENPPVLPTGWWNKRHNRALMISSVLTLFSVLGIGLLGVHLREETFVWGLIIGIAFNLILCVSDWHNLDYLDKTKNLSRKIQMKSRSPKWRVIISIPSFILLYLSLSQFGWGLISTFVSAFCLVFLTYYFKLDSMNSLILLLSVGSLSGWLSLLTFISGFCLTAFLYYLSSIYWEKKNKKIVLIYGRNMPELYIVNKGVE